MHTYEGDCDCELCQRDTAVEALVLMLAAAICAASAYGLFKLVALLMEAA